MSPHGGMTTRSSFSGRDFPALGLLPQRIEGRYLVLERADEGQTLEKLSPFLIDKAIRNCCGEVTSVKRIYEGKILIQTKTDKQASQLEKLNELAKGINVKISGHKTMNVSRIVISCRDLLDVDDAEILEELQPQKVTKLERIHRKINGGIVKTSTFILTVETAAAPRVIKIGFLIVKARPYYPRPMRCFQCLAFGHIGKFCKTEKVCVNCGEKEHGEQCDKPSKCVNCKNQHKATDRDCPAWIRETEIVKTKIDQNISFPEARRIVNSRFEVGRNYAEITTLENKRCNCKCNCGLIENQLTGNRQLDTVKNTQQEPKKDVQPKTNITTPEQNVSGNGNVSKESNLSPKPKRTKTMSETSSEISASTSRSEIDKKISEKKTKRKRGRKSRQGRT